MELIFSICLRNQVKIFFLNYTLFELFEIVSELEKYKSIICLFYFLDISTKISFLFFKFYSYIFKDKCLNRYFPKVLQHGASTCCTPNYLSIGCILCRSTFKLSTLCIDYFSKYSEMLS